MKILHTGDLHIGMQFKGYPANVRKELIDARYQTLKNLVVTANDEKCDLFIIAGDLFDSTKNTKDSICKVIDILSDFSGSCVLIMPGNHDFDDGINDLWRKFKSLMPEKMLLLNENKPYFLKEYGLNASIYAAYCNQRHSQENNLGWINVNDDSNIKIGISHGAIEGLSPDINNNYYYMTMNELYEIPVDIWLIGHTHVRYPDNNFVINQKIFNCGTPEPDGLDYKGFGNAWLIDIDEEIKAKSINVGKYIFYDLVKKVENEQDFERLLEDIINDNSENKLVRLTLKGFIDEDLYKARHKYMDILSNSLFYFTYIDTDLKIKVKQDIIDKEFTKGSFPHRLLSSLLDDEEALQIAYELVKEAKGCV